MRSIQNTYNTLKIRRPEHGSYLCLAESIKGRKFSRKSLVRAFKEIMPENEYCKSETTRLINHLEYLTNRVEEVEIGAKNALETF